MSDFELALKVAEIIDKETGWTYFGNEGAEPVQLPTVYIALGFIDVIDAVRGRAKTEDE